MTLNWLDFDGDGGDGIKLMVYPVDLRGRVLTDC